MASHTLRRGGLLLLLCASLACRAAALTAMSGWEDGFATFYGALRHMRSGASCTSASTSALHPCGLSGCTVF